MSLWPDAGGSWDTGILSYSTFDQIPHELHSSAGLYQWLMKNPQRFEQIPSRLHTDPMRYLAMTETIAALSWIDAASTPSYLALVLDAVQSRPEIIAQVETAYLSEDFLFAVVQARPDTFFYMMRESCDRFDSLVSQRIVDVSCSTSPRLLYKMLHDQNWKTPRRIQDMIADQHFADSMRHCSEEVEYLKRCGKLHVLTDMIKEGYWPAPDDGVCRNDTAKTIQSYAGRIPSATEAWRERVVDANNEIMGMGFYDKKIGIFFEAVIKLYPVANVLKWFQPKHFEAAREIYTLDEVLGWDDPTSQSELLKGVYTTEELKPHMLDYPFLKAIVLEAELGM